MDDLTDDEKRIVIEATYRAVINVLIHSCKTYLINIGCPDVWADEVFKNIFQEKGDKAMKLNELFDEAQRELTEERKTMAKSVIKERLREISMTRKTLDKMEQQLNGLLSHNIDDLEEIE